MENVRKYFGTVAGAIERSRKVNLAVLGFSAVVCLGVCAMSYALVRESRSSIFVVDKGSTLMATIASGKVQKDLELEDHVRRFHELFFNLAPSHESQQRNLERALHMGDRSIYDFWQDQSETGYYNRLVSANISQEIQVDSVHLSIQRYPYPVTTYGKVYLTRESSITAYEFVSECIVTEVPRSASNPHGMMIEKFKVARYESLGSRRRR